MPVRQPGQIIFTWDPKGVIGDLQNAYTLEHGIETARVKLPRRVGYRDLMNLAREVAWNLRRVVWQAAMGNSRGVIETGIDIPDEVQTDPHSKFAVGIGPHRHADGTVHEH